MGWNISLIRLFELTIFKLIKLAQQTKSKITEFLEKG